MPTYNVTDPTTGRKVRLTGDSPPTEQELVGVFSGINAKGGGTPEPASAPNEEPGWLSKAGSTIKGAMPSGETLYGMIRPTMEMGGALLGGALAIPANAVAPGVAEVAGTGLGYLAGKKGADWIDQLSGKTPTPTAFEALKQTVKDVPDAATMAMSGPVFGKGLQLAGKGAGAAIKPLLGSMSGTGTGAVEEALASSAKPGFKLLSSKTAFDKALRGKITGDEVVENARTAFQALKDQRATSYQTKLAEISKITTPIDASPAKGPIKNLLDRYNIKANSDGSVDISRVAMGNRGREDIKSTIETISKWGAKPGDQTPVGLDILKRQLDDFYSESSQARGFVSSLRNIVKDLIVKKVPEYAEMTKGYSEATKMVKDIESGLMMRKQGMSGRIVADQTLRRLMSSMRDNFALRKDLVNALSDQSKMDISGQVAGYTMRSVIPRGLAGTGPAIVGEALAVKVLNPNLWPILLASSPRVQGEFLRIYGKGLSELAGTAPLVGKAIGYSMTGKKETNNNLDINR